MTYERIETRGTIERVLETRHFTPEQQPDIVCPGGADITRVVIDRRPYLTGQACIDLFGRFGPEYVGRKIKVVQSYENSTEGLERVEQQIFIDGALEMAQTILKRVKL